MAGPFRNVKMSKPALTHTFKKLRSSSKCKKCDSYVYFNGAECELVCARFKTISISFIDKLWSIKFSN